MSTLTDLALSPLAVFFRFCHSRPILAKLGSGAAGAIAFVTGHPDWMAILVSCAAYLLIVSGEQDARAKEESAVSSGTP